MGENEQNTLTKSRKNKQLKERNKTAQDLKMKIEAIKKTHIERILEIKKFKNSNRIYRAKHHQQNTRIERKNVRH